MSNFLETDDFRRLLLPFVPLDTLVNMRDINKEWRIETDFYLKAAEASGTTIVHSGRDKSCVGYDGGLLDLLDGWSEACLAKMVERSSVCTVIFHPNVTKIGSLSFGFAVNLVCVELPEGVKTIGELAFAGCTSLKRLQFPRGLTTIEKRAFSGCGLSFIDLRETMIHTVGDRAFEDCLNLNHFDSMLIPPSLQNYGKDVFFGCNFSFLPEFLGQHGMDMDEVDNHFGFLHHRTFEYVKAESRNRDLLASLRTVITNAVDEIVDPITNELNARDAQIQAKDTQIVVLQCEVAALKVKLAKSTDSTEDTKKRKIS